MKTQSGSVTIGTEEGSSMLLRLRNFLMVVVFGWWMSSLMAMDPLMLEWVAALLGA